MNKIYFTAPLVALILFAGVYTWSQAGRKERAAAQEAALQAEHAAQIAAEKEARRVTFEKELRIQEQRRKERAERQAREAAEREARTTALDARDQVFHEQQRLAREIERLKRDVATEQEAVAKLQADHDASLAEQAFLTAFVPEARAQAAELERVLRQIAAAEAARVKAGENAKTKS